MKKLMGREEGGGGGGGYMIEEARDLIELENQR